MMFRLCHICRENIRHEIDDMCWECKVEKILTQNNCGECHKILKECRCEHATPMPEWYI